MLSPKAKAAADKIKSFGESDVKSLSEAIRHEVEHVYGQIARKTRVAEERIRQFTNLASEELQAARKRAVNAVDDHPLSSTVMALAAGVALGYLLAHRSERSF
ncbi:hypothetical protein [Asticcacaulis sp. AC402]|uniref:hypothetical protein n=1 Tax=Asticcacaulis sp. AC402 TaxID=1282361 RepID=UPI0003C3ACA3|nr:hypothetical protein [Asticcacaulis sp. AC402]ESQ74911.1 hypothetical protein ABAC402_12210 [Asticcacaulis sp. AC402]